MAEPVTCPLTPDQSYISIIQVHRIYATVSYAIMVWDWVVTFSQEYKYIWKSPWSPIKVIFLGQRYVSLALLGVLIGWADGNWSQSFCSKYYILDPLVCIPTLLFANLILVLRAYAIWERNRWILGIGFTAMIIQLAIMISASVSLEGAEFPPPVTHGPCLSVERPGYGGISAGLWIAPMVTDFILTALSVYQTVIYYRRGASSSILKVFWRDGIFYFLLITSFNILNAAFFLQKNKTIISINSIFALCMTSILSLRLLLHLRVVAANGTNLSGEKANEINLPSRSGGQSNLSKTNFNAYSEPRSPISMLSHQNRPPYGELEGIKVQVSRAEAKDYDDDPPKNVVHNTDSWV